MKSLTVRFPEDMLQSLKDAHAESYPYHRESFNTWLLGLVAVGQKRIKK